MTCFQCCNGKWTRCGDDADATGRDLLWRLGFLLAEPREHQFGFQCHLHGTVVRDIHVEPDTLEGYTLSIKLSKRLCCWIWYEDRPLVVAIRSYSNRTGCIRSRLRMKSRTWFWFQIFNANMYDTYLGVDARQRNFVNERHGFTEIDSREFETVHEIRQLKTEPTWKRNETNFPRVQDPTRIFSSFFCSFEATQSAHFCRRRKSNITLPMTTLNHATSSVGSLELTDIWNGREIIKSGRYQEPRKLNLHNITTLAEPFVNG